MKQFQTNLKNETTFKADFYEHNTFSADFGEFIHTSTPGSGGIFTPAISEDGYLSWTNNAGLPNPDPVQIIPQKGVDYWTPEEKEEVFKDMAQTICVNNIPLVFENNQINIPIAGTTINESVVPGIVASNENIEVDSNTGGMTVKKVNIRAVHINDEQEVFLGGGNSNETNKIITEGNK